jgi:hypothetical protein
MDQHIHIHVDGCQKCNCRFNIDEFLTEFEHLKEFLMALSQQEVDALTALNTQIDNLDTTIQTAFQRATIVRDELNDQIRMLSTSIGELEAAAVTFTGEDAAEDAAFNQMIADLQQQLAEMQATADAHTTEVVNALSDVGSNLNAISVPTDEPTEPAPTEPTEGVETPEVTEPVFTETVEEVPTEPAPTEPVSTEPTLTEPTLTPEPAPTEPPTEEQPA